MVDKKEDKIKTNMALFVVEQLQKMKQTPFGRLFTYSATANKEPMTVDLKSEEDNDELVPDIYIELGRRFEMWYTGSKRMQVTVRDFKLSKAYQKQGIFTAVVRYLLLDVSKDNGSVQLEAVINPELAKKLQASKLWICIDPTNDINPSFYRLARPEDHASFHLF